VRRQLIAPYESLMTSRHANMDELEGEAHVQARIAAVERPLTMARATMPERTAPMPGPA
jgi:hypothetical protein